MKNLIRMFDLERVLTYQSAMPDNYFMTLPNGQKHSMKIESVMQSIEHSYDWKLNQCTGSTYSFEINPDMLEYQGLSDMGENFDFTCVVDTKYLPQAFVENPYVIGYINPIASNCFYLTLFKRGCIEKEDTKIIVAKVSEEDRKYAVSQTEIHANQILRQLYHYWKWYREERNLYIHDKALVDDLMDTEYPCRTDWLVAPNESMYIMLPKKVTDTDGKDTEHPFEGMYVNLEEYKNDDKLIRIYMPSRPDKKDRDVDPLTYNGHYWELVLEQGMNIVKSVDNAVFNSTPVSDDINESMHKIMKYYTLLAVQTILYITSVNSVVTFREPVKKDISENRKRKFINREETQEDHAELGGGIYINNRIARTANASNGTATKTGRKLNKLILVRGHFAKYWLKDPNKIAKLKPYEIMETKYDDMGKRMVAYKKYKQKFYKGRGEIVVPKEYILK
jgi:hypothetical protein